MADSNRNRRSGITDRSNLTDWMDLFAHALTMPEFLTVAKVGDIPLGEGRTYPVNGKLIAIFRVGDEYHAINDLCPHMGASLATGWVEGNSVTCPWHAWRFCITDGLWLDNPKSKIRTEVYQVQVVGDEIQVEVPGTAEKAPAG